MAKNKRKLIIGAIAVLGASAAGTIAILKKKKREIVFRENSINAIEELESFIMEDNAPEDNNANNSINVDMNKESDLENNKTDK